MRARCGVGILVSVFLTATAAGGGCAGEDGGIELRSAAFDDGGAIPVRYSCEGDNVSPPLAWSKVDGDVKALALVVADPEAPGGIFHHWIVLDLDPRARSMAEGKVPADATQALGTSDNPTYIGPCPPVGEEHHYLFTLFPLDRRLDLPDGTATEVALDAIDAARLPGEGELRGTFGR